ncbi:hypothetical protein BH20ACI3_BH20ACI3_06610 [soil metagenome]
MANSSKQTSQTTFTARLSSSLLLCALATCVLARCGSAQTNASRLVLTQPYTMREDFQGDSLGQWASYPPAQDVGYEPSLAPTSQYDAPGGRSLMRVVKPNVPSALRFGFIKKIRIVVSDDATVSFAYRVNTPGTGAQIELGLAGTNGTLYTRRTAAQTNRWTVADARFSELRDSRGNALPSGLRAEAIYLVARLGETDPDITYRFMIDDLSLKAAREAHFSVTTPASEAIDPWPVLVSDRGYRAADKIAFETTAPARLTRVNCTLKTPDSRVAITQKLYDDGTHGDRRSADGIWSNSDVYSLSAADQTGLWSAQLDGSTAGGETVSTVVRLIVHPATNATGGHPRLFFNAGDRQKLSERSRDPKLSSLWAHLQSTAKNTRVTGELAHGGAVFELLDSQYLLPSLLAYFDVLNRARSRIAHNAFEVYLTDSAEARAAAKSAMLDVANWKRWQPPWFNAHGQHTYYPAGLLAADVALGYDLLYNDLTESERAQIRRALIEKSIIPTYKEYVVDNRVMANTSNWIAHTVGGALIAAASIAGDVQASELPSESPSKSNVRFEILLNGLLLKLEDHLAASFLSDGSYGEGTSYHEFDTETLAPALNALRRVFGIDYWKQTHVLDSLNYPLFTLAQPPSGSLDMGDTHPPAGHGIAALAYESKDPVMRWYYAQFDRPSLSKFIFYDNSVAPQAPRAPKLPTSRIFRDKGNAVFRSGWDKEAIIFLYRAGPNFNHHHADQGSFLLNAFGENLVTEAGWSDYYKDPYYATFFTQAIGHSTVLVDGNPESQNIADTPQFTALNSYPRITDAVTSEFYDSVCSELASVYRNRLERFTRRIVFMKPHYFVIFDDLVAKDKPARFDWLLHLPDRSRIETQDKLAIYRGKQAALAVRAYAPGDLDMRVREGRVPYPDFATRTPPATPAQPAFLDLATKPLQATRFLVALVPARTSAAAQAQAGNMSEVKDEQWLGIRTRRGSEMDLVMFRVAGPSPPMAYDKWLTDAASWAVTEAGDQLVTLSAHNARTVSRSGRQLFSSDKSASFAAHFAAEKVQANFSATSATQVRLFTGAAPIKVQLNGRDLNRNSTNYVSSERMISLLVPAGKHELVFTLR